MIVVFRLRLGGVLLAFRQRFVFKGYSFNPLRGG